MRVPIEPPPAGERGQQALDMRRMLANRVREMLEKEARTLPEQTLQVQEIARAHVGRTGLKSRN